MDTNEFRVEIRKVARRTGKVVGVASLLFQDPEKDGFRISGFKILTEGNFGTGYTDAEGSNLWVAPPAYPDPVTGKLIGMFFMALPLWKKLEAKILESFLSSKTNRTR